MGSVSHDEGDVLSRRAVLARAGSLAAAGALAPLPRVADRLGLLGVAPPSTGAVVRDTLGGLVAYAVPGNDRYSLAQGVSTAEPGGVAAGAVDRLHSTLDLEGPGVVDAATVILNARAQGIAPGVGTRGFASPFAALSYARKDQVVRTLAQSREATLRVLGSTVPALAVFLSYSEAAVLDPRTGHLRGVPVGWRITGYSGVADIRNEFRGYYGGHRTALSGGPFE